MLYLYALTQEGDMPKIEALWGLFSSDPAVYEFGRSPNYGTILENANAAIHQEAEDSQSVGGLKLAGWEMSTQLWPNLVNLSLRDGKPLTESMRHELDRKYNDSWMFMNVDRIFSQGQERGWSPDLGAALSFWLPEETFMTEKDLRLKWESAGWRITEEIGITVASYLQGMKRVVDLYYARPPQP